MYMVKQTCGQYFQSKVNIIAVKLTLGGTARYLSDWRVTSDWLRKKK